MRCQRFNACSLVTGYYRVYKALSVPFVLTVDKSSDIDLFTASIIAVNRDYDNSSFHLFVVTECADFLKLRIPTLLSYPDIGGTLEVVDEAVNGDCFGSDTVCLQIWEVRSRGTLDCPPTNVKSLHW